MDGWWQVRLVAPRDMPKLGKGGSLKSRQALVHSLVHTESWAIDLSWVSVGVGWVTSVVWLSFPFNVREG
jgi:hypothetical protein